jgi:hypothetical protein
MAQVVWANAAIDDLQRLREYFTPASPRFAEKLMDQLLPVPECWLISPKAAGWCLNLKTRNCGKYGQVIIGLFIDWSESIKWRLRGYSTVPSY